MSWKPSSIYDLTQMGYFNSILENAVHKMKGVLDLAGVNFLHRRPYGAIFWICETKIVITHQCFSFC